MRQLTDAEFWRVTWTEDDAKAFIVALTSGIVTALLLALILRRKG